MARVDDKIEVKLILKSILVFLKIVGVALSTVKQF